MTMLRLLPLALLAALACGDARGPSDGDAGHDARDGGADEQAARDGSTDAAREPPAEDAEVPREAGPRDGAASTDAATNSDAATSTDAATPSVLLPPPNGALDYQLGAAYPPKAGVQIVVRDRTAAPASGLYNVCYVNGFQAQPGEESFWMQQHPALVLRDGEGKPVIDADWNELLLDVSTKEKRGELAAIVGAWIEGCARAGFRAVEIDNLDSYSRSRGLLKPDHAVAFMGELARIAHESGLAIAQKNASELVARRAELGTDFAIAEECNRYDECDDYRDGYGDHLLVIEYRKSDFDRGCAQYPELSIVLRDLELVGPGAGGYVFQGC